MLTLQSLTKRRDELSVILSTLGLDLDILKEEAKRASRIRANCKSVIIELERMIEDWE